MHADFHSFISDISNFFVDSDNSFWILEEYFLDLLWYSLFEGYRHDKCLSLNCTINIFSVTFLSLDQSTTVHGPNMANHPFLHWSFIGTQPLPFVSTFSCSSAAVTTPGQQNFLKKQESKYWEANMSGLGANHLCQKYFTPHCSTKAVLSKRKKNECGWVPIQKQTPQVHSLQFANPGCRQSTNNTF